MFSQTVKVPCSIIRGGTSKGVFFGRDVLPTDPKERDAFILRAFGSPDLRQIDGLGGANSLTSKVAIISKSDRGPGIVDYTFGQVAVDKSVIDWRGNCGNLSTAVGLYALLEGLAKIESPSTTVKVYNTNTDKMIYITLPVEGGQPVEAGDFYIPGVPFPGSKILVEFERPEGSVCKKLLPTGRPTDQIEVPGKGVFTYSFVDAANPVIFLVASELGLVGTELPEAVEKMPEKLALIEELRGRISQETGIVGDWASAASVSPAIPKIGFVSEARNYKTPDGKEILAGDVDFVARLASMQKMHRAYMVTGAICTATAARIEGTVVARLLRPERRDTGEIRIGHPYGSMEVTIDVDHSNGFEVRKAGVYRTARKIMGGEVYVPCGGGI